MIHKLNWLAKLLKRSSVLPTSKPETHTRFIFEEMEPRKLFSADPLGGLLDVDDFELPQVEMLVMDHVSESTENYSKDSDNLVSDDQISVLNIDLEIRRELVFVDSTVENYDQLIDDLSSQDDDSRVFSVFVLDSGKNGIDQITEELQNHDDIDALHIISHGTQGTVALGNTQLNSSNLNDYAAQIAQWQNAFDQDADLLIYGCKLAGSEAGEALITQLSALTGTDVAASVDDTGNVAQGGDWVLEFSTGAIETQIAVSKQTQQSWEGLLAFHTYRDEFNNVSFAGNDGSANWANDWQEFGETNGANTGQLNVSSELSEQGLSIANSNNGVWRQANLSDATRAFLSFDYARISLDDASDSVTLEISSDGGTSWSSLDSWQGMADDTDLTFISYDITDYIASNTQIKFTSLELTDGGDRFFVDNVQIAYSSNLVAKPEFLVNQNTVGTQETSVENRGSHQSVAVASNGDYVVVWTEVESTGDLSDVYAQQYYADGTVKTAAFQVNTTSVDDQQWAMVASDASGRFVIAWTSQNQDGNGQGVYLKRFDANGTAIDTDDILVNSLNTLGNENYTSIALNSQGEMVITWQSNEAGNEGVYARKFDMTSAATGNVVPTALITVASGANNVTPSVDINSEGKFIIVWRIDDEPHAQRFNPDGSLRGSQIDINPLDFGLGLEQHPVVAVQESGDFLVAYRSEIIKGVWVKHYRDDGSAVALATNVSSGSSSHTTPSIAKDLEGNFIVIYEGNGDGDGLGVFARKYDANRNALEAAFQINETTTLNQQMASIAMLDLDRYVVVWSGNGPDDANGVFAKQINTSSGLNNLPIADASAGSPYVINEGDSITLDATNSSDPDLDTLTYLWDLNNDSVYGDEVGENPMINWATLQSYNINDDGVYTIGLKVDDGYGGIDTTTTTITVNNTAPALSTTGLSTVALGDDYSLNLSAVDPGADTITEWTINWGDGAIETFAGNPAVVTHTYTNSGFTNNILVSVTDEDGTYLQNELLVTDYTGTGGIFHFSETGELLSPVIGTSDLDKSIGIIVGPDENWYGSGESSENVYRYNTDGGTSKVIMGGITDAAGLAFDSDGNLLVASWAQNKVYKLTHNTTDDSYTQTEIVSDTTFNRPYGLVFDSNGDLYVSSYADHNVKRLELNADGSYTASVFISNGLGGLNSPEQMAFGPDGKLYLTSAGSGEILRYNPGSLNMDVIAALPSGGKPEGLAFGSDGNLYISDHDFGDIIRFNMGVNATTGELEVQGGAETFIDGANSTLTKPVFMTFVPEQQVTVINTNQTPVIADQTFSLPENSQDGVTVGTVTATDPDAGDNLSYAITAGNDLNAFAMTGGGVITVADSSQLDFETNPAFSLTVQVMDDGTGTLSSSATVSINLSQVNEAPVINDQAFSLPENSQDGVIVGTVTATDPDAGDNLSYTITAGNDLNAFAMTGGGVITVADSSQLDFETNPAFSLAVQVMDDGTGTLSSSATVSINLSQVNEAPVIIDQTFSLAENSANGSAVGTVIATDQNAADSLSYSIIAGNNSSAFTINSKTGEITVADNSQLNFETTPVFNLTIQVTDNGIGGLSDTATINIDLIDINEIPNSISLSNNIIAEHIDTSAGATIGLMISSDEEAHSYQIIGGIDQDKFSIGENVNNELILNDGVLDFENQSSYQVTVSAIDSEGINHEETFTIIVNNLNEKPVITSSNSITHAENSSRVTSVVAEDQSQPEQTLSYTLSGGADSALFLLDSNTGELSFKTTPDFENPVDSNRENVYLIEITVNDGEGGTNTQSLSIQVEDMAEAPDLSDQSVSLDEQSSNGTLVSTLTATDPDYNESFSYRIIGGDLLNVFTIDDSGKLIVSDPESLINQDSSTVSLIVQVTDSRGLTDTSTVKINVEELKKTGNIEQEINVEPGVVEAKDDEEFSYSVLTKIPSESAKPISTNTVEGDSEPAEQIEAENKIDPVDSSSFIIEESHGAQRVIEEDDNKITIGFSESVERLSGSQGAEEHWGAGNILIKVKAVVVNSKIIPQFSYFDIETKALQYLIEESGFSQSLDLFREQQDDIVYLEKTVVGSSITVTTGLSIGYVIWLVRGGVLLSTALSSLPAWRMIDPLPVITSLNNLSADDKNGDSLASLIKKGSEAAKERTRNNFDN